MIKIQNINDRELKKELDNYFEINLMISKIPEIKKKLVEFSQIKLMDIYPNEDLINQNFEFLSSKSFSLKPSKLKEQFIEDNQVDIRNILIEYITEYDFYKNNKNKILNDYICYNLLNTYILDLFILKNLIPERENQIKMILSRKYHNNNSFTNRNISNLQSLLKNIRNDEIYDKFVNSSFFKSQLSLPNVDIFNEINKKYSKGNISYFLQINEKSFDELFIINESLKDMLIKYMIHFTEHYSSGLFGTVNQKQSSFLINELKYNSKNFFRELFKFLHINYNEYSEFNQDFSEPCSA